METGKLYLELFYSLIVDRGVAAIQANQHVVLQNKY